MDALRIHLLLNYYPAIGMVIGTILIIAGYWFKNAGLKRASLKIFIAVALFTFPAYVTGEIGGARNKATYQGPHAESLQRHKDAARPAFLLTALAGIAAVAALIIVNRGSAYGRWTTHAVLALSILTCVSLIWTAYAGRQIKWAGMPPPTQNGLTPAR